MAEGWFPGAIVDWGNDAGAYTDNGEPKGLLHTTEGKNYAGARSAYVANNSWPHATCSYEHGRFEIWQHNSILVAARALKNQSGGVETNRDRVAQLEIVGTADRNNATSWGNQYVENFPQPYLDGIARWMAFCNENLGIPNRCTVKFKTYPESSGTNNGIRLSAHDFDMYSGWLGHQHAAENTHGDPGLIDITYLLERAGGTEPSPSPEPEDDDMQDFIISAPNRPISLMRGDKLVKFGDMDTVKSFQAAGVKTVKPTTRDFDKIEQVLAAAELVDDVSVPNPD